MLNEPVLLFTCPFIFLGGKLDFLLLFSPFQLLVKYQSSSFCVMVRFSLQFACRGILPNNCHPNDDPIFLASRITVCPWGGAFQSSTTCLSACETSVRESKGEDATQVSCRALGTQCLPSMLCLLLAPAACDATPEAFREGKIKAASRWRLPVQKLWLWEVEMEGVS